MMMLLFWLWRPKRLFMKTHLLALLHDNCLDLVRCAFLRKLSACVRNITAFCQHLPNPNIGPIYWPGRYIGVSLQYGLSSNLLDWAGYYTLHRFNFPLWWPCTSLIRLKNTKRRVAKTSIEVIWVQPIALIGDMYLPVLSCGDVRVLLSCSPSAIHAIRSRLS